VPRELVELDERALVEQRLDALAAVILPLACCFSTAFSDATSTPPAVVDWRCGQHVTFPREGAPVRVLT
jgi:hypothetical protein